jgi:hypothetical protein
MTAGDGLGDRAQGAVHLACVFEAIGEYLDLHRVALVLASEYGSRRREVVVCLEADISGLGDRAR